MSDARGDILARVVAALADAPAEVPVPREYERTLRPGIDAVDLFAERVADYRATVHRATAADLPGVVASVLAAHRSCASSSRPVSRLAGSRPRAAWTRSATTRRSRSRTSMPSTA